MLGISPGVSARATGAFNHWAFSPVSSCFPKQSPEHLKYPIQGWWYCTVYCIVEGREKRKHLADAQLSCNFLSPMFLMCLVGSLCMEPGGMEGWLSDKWTGTMCGGSFENIHNWFLMGPVERSHLPEEATFVLTLDESLRVSQAEQVWGGKKKHDPR